MAGVVLEYPGFRHHLVPGDTTASGLTYTSFVIDEIGRTLIGYTKDQSSNGAGYEGVYGFRGEDFGAHNIILANNVIVGWPENSITSDLTVTGEYRLASLNTAPANSGATGVLGEIRYDASYIYLCTATNTWKRAQFTTW